jgi:hypothetical protein
MYLTKYSQTPGPSSRVPKNVGRPSLPQYEQTMTKKMTPLANPEEKRHRYAW